eukprot:CAMPEP_0175448638 /NCGR_PEP_ID=MMETSP0095-20121207/61429_1 /TAXON_ID=311494 /ORGANISM="Alexandrium monilatum, Strain CCMP3105" /LENGTH=191 /DNA_ID=CAMNT_0016749029 /DNA_START=192 /DNA_END=764 /DNA_ORIENTATION=-
MEHLWEICVLRRLAHPTALAEGPRRECRAQQLAPPAARAGGGAAGRTALPQGPSIWYVPQLSRSAHTGCGARSRLCRREDPVATQWEGHGHEDGGLAGCTQHPKRPRVLLLGIEQLGDFRPGWQHCQEQSHLQREDEGLRRHVPAQDRRPKSRRGGKGPPLHEEVHGRRHRKARPVGGAGPHGTVRQRGAA